MTEEELIQGSCSTYSRFNELLYAFPGNSSDGIPNLSDLKLAYDDKVGKTWNSSSTYSIGDIVTYEFYTYVSLTNNNAGNTPPDFPGNWNKIETNTCEVGSVYVAAHCAVELSNQGGYSATVKTSYNIDSVSFQGSRVFEVVFDDSINLFDDSYLIIQGGDNSRYNRGINLVNVISKSATGFVFMTPDGMPEGALVFTQLVNFAIIPQQNSDN